MKIKELLAEMIKVEASDLFYRAGGVPHLRIDGKVKAAGGETLTLDDVIKAAEELTTAKQRELFKANLDIDFAVYLEEFQRRFRVSIFMQRNWPSIIIRNIRNQIGSFEELNLPAEVCKKLAMETRGLIILTGSTGSGKSTTIASLIEYINSTYEKHILTIEEPIEFTFKDKNSVINQRELGTDVQSYATALRAFTLQSPDVIYIANIRDLETMSAALTIAETGVLVLATLHTINAAQTVERIVNFFPPYQHAQVRMQLSSLLKGVMSLRLVPQKGQPGRVPAYETMLLSPSIARLIREDKIYEIPHFIEDGSIFGMQSFNQTLVHLVNQNKITAESAEEFCDNKEEFALLLKGIKKR